jgi:cysteine desulfurase family protein
MPAGRIYLDNAATSFPKPPGVIDAVRDYMLNVGVSAGRGAYREAAASGQTLAACRGAIRTLFNATPDDHVAFTLNGTDALNIAIKGLVGPNRHVVTTTLDHNSVLRPLTALEQRFGVRWTAVEPDRATTRLQPQQIDAAIRDDTALVVVNHASNVTGAIQPIEQMTEVCRARKVPFLVDAAQSAGHVPIDFSAAPIDVLACPGHKGLLGPLGTGVLVIRAGFGERIATFREGGTGSASEQPRHPEFLPDRFEAGSHNTPGIAGLLAGVRWLLDRGVPALREHEIGLSRKLASGLDQIHGLTWFGSRDPAQRVGVFSVRLDGFGPEELSVLLEQQAGILTRSGLHCAPLAHRTIGTHETGGTTRISLGPLSTVADVEALLAALGELAPSASARS